MTTRLDLTPGSEHLLPYAKKKLAELDEMDIDRRLITVSTGEEIYVQKGEVSLIRIRGSTEATTAIVILGATSALFDVTANRPVPSSGHPTLTRASIATSLLDSPKISFTRAYLTAGAIIADNIFGVTNVVDAQAGSVAVVTGLQAREFDFTTGLVWFGYGTAHLEFLYAIPAVSIAEMVNGFSEDFPVSVTDGVQTYAVPMADGRFTINLPVTYTGGAITSYPLSVTLGAWQLQIVSITLADASLRVNYRQTRSGLSIFPMQDVREWDFTPPPDINPPDPNNSVIYDSDILEIPGFSLPEPPYPMFVETRIVTTEVFTMGPDTDGDGDEDVHVLTQAFIQEVFLRYSDGSAQQLTGSRFAASGVSGIPSYPAGTPIDYTAYGERGLIRTVTAPSNADANDSAVWVDSDPALGYSVRRFLPPGVAVGTEAYEITFNGSIVRTALRSETATSFGGAEEAQQTHVTTLTGESASGYTGTAQWGDGDFSAYDAPVAVAPGLSSILKTNNRAGTNVGTPALALLPFGWGSASAAALRELELVLDLRPPVAAIRAELVAARTLNASFAEAPLAALDAYIAFIDSILASIDGPSPLKPKQYLSQIVTYFGAETRFLIEVPGVTARLALNAGPGTFLLVSGL